MKKKYFVQLLAVEEEIEIEDKVDVYVPVGEPPYYHEIATVKGFNEEEDVLIFDTFTVGKSFCKKVKLFLCSTDIQVGDEICWLDIYGKIQKTVPSTQDFIDSAEDCFKPLGEISLEAIWIKEGDEFDDCAILHGEQICSAPHNIKSQIFLACPICKQFYKS